MTLCDAGPLVALVDVDDPHHQRCIEALEKMENLVSTWPCVTEAMHLLDRAGGHKAQDALWDYCEDGLIDIYVAPGSEWRQIRDLMRKYSDTPMDLADASIVTAAERLGIARVFTTDPHFYAYRKNGKEAFEVIP